MKYTAATLAAAIAVAQAAPVDQVYQVCQAYTTVVSGAPIWKPTPDPSWMNWDPVASTTTTTWGSWDPKTPVASTTTTSSTAWNTWDPKASTTTTSSSWASWDPKASSTTTSTSTWASWDPKASSTTTSTSTWASWDPKASSTTTSSSSWSAWSTSSSSSSSSKSTTTYSYTTPSSTYTKPSSTSTTTSSTPPAQSTCGASSSEFDSKPSGSCGCEFETYCNQGANVDANTKFWERNSGELINSLSECLAICNDNTECTAVIWTDSASAGTGDYKHCYQTSGLAKPSKDSYGQISYKGTCSNKCSADYMNL